MSSNLSLHELYKYPWRIDKFLENYRNNEQFELFNGGFINLIFDPNIENRIKNREKNLVGNILLGIDGNKYKLSDLRKTKEFGGKGQGYSVKVETNEIESINKQIYEIKNQTLMSHIQVVIASNVYSITHCTKTFGTPKSDFHFMNNNEEAVWISHKKGYKPTHFQQYSGITPFEYHVEISSFVNDIKQKFPQGIKTKQCLGRCVDDINLEMKSIYGLEYNIKPFNKENVTALIQGSIQFTRSDNYFMIQSNKLHKNGDILDGAYEPIMISRYNKERNQFGINNARFLISPKNGRKINEFI